MVGGEGSEGEEGSTARLVPARRGRTRLVVQRALSPSGNAERRRCTTESCHAKRGHAGERRWRTCYAWAFGVRRDPKPGLGLDARPCVIVRRPSPSALLVPPLSPRPRRARPLHALAHPSCTPSYPDGYPCRRSSSRSPRTRPPRGRCAAPCCWGPSRRCARRVTTTRGSPRSPPSTATPSSHAVAGVWLPLDTALAYYAACDSLGLSSDTVAKLGGRTFDPNPRHPARHRACAWPTGRG